jgi:hypothetical protein
VRLEVFTIAGMKVSVCLSVPEDSRPGGACFRQTVRERTGILPSVSVIPRSLPSPPTAHITVACYSATCMYDLFR